MRRLFVVALVVAFTPLALSQEAEGTCVPDVRIESDHDARFVRLSWGPVEGATAYHVHRAVDGGPSEPIAVLDGETLERVDSPAPEGVLDYRVAANGPPGLDCPAVSVHLGGGLPPPGEAVCASDVRAQALSGGIVRISWSPVPGAVSYDVLRGSDGGTLVPHLVVTGSATSVIDEAVQPGVTYTYAVNANGLVTDARCEEAMVTAIPFFAALWAAVAAGLSLVVYAASRRR